MPLRQWQEVQEMLWEMREIEMPQSIKRIEYRDGILADSRTPQNLPVKPTDDADPEFLDDFLKANAP